MDAAFTVSGNLTSTSAQRKPSPSPFKEPFVVVVIAAAIVAVVAVVLVVLVAVVVVSSASSSMESMISYVHEYTNISVVKHLCEIPPMHSEYVEKLEI